MAISLPRSVFISRSEKFSILKPSQIIRPDVSFDTDGGKSFITVWEVTDLPHPDSLIKIKRYAVNGLYLTVRCPKRDGNIIYL